MKDLDQSLPAEAAPVERRAVVGPEEEERRLPHHAVIRVRGQVPERARVERTFLARGGKEGAVETAAPPKGLDEPDEPILASVSLAANMPYSFAPT